MGPTYKKTIPSGGGAVVVLGDGWGCLEVIKRERENCIFIVCGSHLTNLTSKKFNPCGGHMERLTVKRD